MRTIKLFFLLTVLFCSGNQLFGQPGESDKKYNVHEIKLFEREDGSKAGAVAWFTASPDSVQKFVIRNLSIMEPVEVLLQALTPKDEVTLQFVKEKWDQPESSISAKGKNIGKKIFRTYKTAAMKISAEKAGIPYLILVQVGKKLPVNKSPLLRIITDKNEYEAYLKNNGKTSSNETDTRAAVIPVTNNEPGGGNTPNNSSLLYIIIGLLALMVAFLGYFVFLRKGSKKALALILLFGLNINLAWSQEGGPIQLPVENTGDGSIYTDAGVTGIINQYLIADLLKRLSVQASQLADLDRSYALLSEQLNALEEMVFNDRVDFSETDSALFDAYFELKNEFETFKNDFADNMPGEDTEDGNRTISEADFNRLRARTDELEAQVDYLSNRDRSYNPEDYRGDASRAVLCGDDTVCKEKVEACGENYASKIIDRKEKLIELNRIMRKNDWEIEYFVDTGNNLSNMAPGVALGWQTQYKNIQIARRSLWAKYHAKYDELKDKYNQAVEEFDNCLFDTVAGYDIVFFRNEANNWRERNVPELTTPMF